MATRISPHHTSNVLKQQEFPIKGAKTSRRKRKNNVKINSLKVKSAPKKAEKSIAYIKFSLRQECLQLASFLRQETHRPGYVR